MYERKRWRIIVYHKMVDAMKNVNEFYSIDKYLSNVVTIRYCSRGTISLLLVQLYDSIFPNGILLTFWTSIWISSALRIPSKRCTIASISMTSLHPSTLLHGQIQQILR